MRAEPSPPPRYSSSSEDATCFDGLDDESCRNSDIQSSSTRNSSHTVHKTERYRVPTAAKIFSGGNSLSREDDASRSRKVNSFPYGTDENVFLERSSDLNGDVRSSGKVSPIACCGGDDAPFFEAKEQTPAPVGGSNFCDPSPVFVQSAAGGDPTRSRKVARYSLLKNSGGQRSGKSCSIIFLHLDTNDKEGEEAAANNFDNNIRLNTTERSGQRAAGSPRPPLLHHWQRQDMTAIKSHLRRRFQSMSPSTWASYSSLGVIHEDRSCDYWEEQQQPRISRRRIISRR
jgi:hypothetical protein